MFIYGNRDEHVCLLCTSVYKENNTKIADLFKYNKGPTILKALAAHVEQEAMSDDNTRTYSL